MKSNEITILNHHSISITATARCQQRHVDQDLPLDGVVPGEGWWRRSLKDYAQRFRVKVKVHLEGATTRRGCLGIIQRPNHWLVVTGTMEFWMTFRLSHHIGNDHPNWRTHSMIFQRGGEKPPTSSHQGWTKKLGKSGCLDLAGTSPENGRRMDGQNFYWDRRFRGEVFNEY